MKLEGAIFCPAEDRYLIEQIEQESQTKGGLYVPDAAKQRPMKGKIVAKGTGKPYTATSTDHNMHFNVGDVVVFPKYAGIEFRIDEKDYLIVKQHEIMGLMP